MDKTIKKWIKLFIYDMEFKKNRSYNTVVSLRVDLQQLEDSFSLKGIFNIDEIEDYMLREYFFELRKSSIAATTLNRKISSVKQFYKYLKAEGLINNNFALMLDMTQSDKKKIEYLTKKEISALRETIVPNNFNSYRDKFLFELLYSSGITVSELLLLGEASINADDRELYIIKNKEKKVLFFSERCKKSYLDYIEIKNEKFKEKNDRKILFVNNSNNRLTDRSIRRIIDKYSKEANIKKDVSPYTLRHSFCIHILKAGMPKEHLKKLLNFQNFEMLNEYERIIKRELIK